MPAWSNQWSPARFPVDPAYPESNITFGPPPGGEDLVWLSHRSSDLSGSSRTARSARQASCPNGGRRPEELVLINAGQPVRTHIVARGLPPQMVWVKKPEEV
jgi:hypothetical protein